VEEMMNVLVTGGAGYLGGAVVDIMLENKWKFNVTVYDNLLYEDNYYKDVNFVFGDIRDTSKLLKELQKSDAVIWLAAIVGDEACRVNIEETLNVNQESLKWLSENFNGRIVFPSSCSCYGAQDGTLNESSSLKPLSVYANTKVVAEEYLSGNNSIIYRLGTLFGVGDRFSRVRFDLVVNTMTMKAFTTKEIIVYGGNQYRPVIHVKDVANQMVRSLYGTDTGIYNLHKQNICMIDLAHQIKNHFNDVQIKYIETMFEDLRNYRVSSDKALSQLEFNPTITIDEGVDEIKYLLSSGRIKNVNSPRHSNFGFLKQRNEQNA